MVLCDAGCPVPRVRALLFSLHFTITMSVVCTQILPLVDWSISRLVSQFKCQSVSCLLVGCLLVGCLLVGCLLVGCLSVGCLL